LDYDDTWIRYSKGSISKEISSRLSLKLIMMHGKLYIIT
jgi:hypothetical protein